MKFLSNKIIKISNKNIFYNKSFSLIFDLKQTLMKKII